MLQWQQPPKLKIPPALLDFVQGDTILAQLLVQRGLTTVEQVRGFLDPAHYRPAPPEVLPDVDRAVARLTQAIDQREPIWVWGDFDADGQTSTTLLVSALRQLGGNVRYYIPNRMTESHGIKLPALERVLAQKAGLILTCDTGIAEHEAVATAQSAGTDVIITDHHDLAETLPPAQAVINPKRLPADHPLRELPGVGVAYKVMQALLLAHGQADVSQSLLDLVALGIVADVARQTGDTRYLLQQGLEVLQTSERLGLQVLIENAHLKTNRLTEDHIGFWLAPRLNALGRLGDANQAVELLTTDNLARARIIALQLEGLNDRRKLLVDRVVVQALSQLEDTPSLAQYNAIVLAAADWHPGVIGIAASRLVEQYGKPVILIALRPNDLGRGSARSVAGCDIHQAIKTQAHLLAGFGGHPMAAGLALAPENLMAFRRGLSEALAGCQPTSAKTLKLDLVVELPQLNCDLLTTIQRLAPFGAGNPSVRLGCRGLRLVDEALFGKAGDHKRLTVEDEAGYRQEVIWWRGAAERSPEGRFDLAVTLSPDDFRGGDAIQVELVAVREWSPTTVVRDIELIDYRPSASSQLSAVSSQPTASPLPITDLHSLISTLPSPVLVWAEGVTLPDMVATPRHKLQRAETLVIWTAPPGQDILAQAVARVRPQQVVLVAQLPPVDTLAGFIQRLMGLIKYAVAQREGEIFWEELAGALGHRIATVQFGIDWLAAQGKLAVVTKEEELVVVRPGHHSLFDENSGIIKTILQSSLTETAAYRQFLRQASLASIKKIIS
ncbi:MAG: single-stranded-DNA-specific exonuclease RecJ [Anaerolineaceae bacterium]|nr:single-stranded-DNA-specific exonuclease RecJ [Anaerolineaceae bacterium]